MDVAVVGGGVTGLFVARFLHQEGIHTTLFERGSLGAGSVHAAGILESKNYYRINSWSYLKRALRYWRNGSSNFHRVDARWLGGFMCSFGMAPTSQDWERLHAMGDRSLLEYRTMAEEKDDFGLVMGGLTEYYHDRNAFRDSVRNARGREGSTNFEVSDWCGGAGSIHYPGMGWLDTELLVSRISKELVPVETVRAEVERVGTDGTVVTGGSPRKFDAVVTTAGVATRRLGIPLTSIKGYGWHAKTARAINCATIFADRGIAAVPLSGSVKVTGGWDFDLGGGTEHSGDVLSRATGLLGITGVFDFKMGHRPCTPDGLPAIGMRDKLAVATGGFRLGWSFAPGMAREAVDLLLGRSHPDRFLSRYLHGMRGGKLAGAFLQDENPALHAEGKVL